MVFLEAVSGHRWCRGRWLPVGDAVRPGGLGSLSVRRDGACRRHGAGTGITANAELTAEGSPYGGLGLSLWGQFVTSNSKSPLGSADNLYVDSCNPNMWYNSGGYQQVQLSVNEQLDSWMVWWPFRRRGFIIPRRTSGHD